MIAKKYKLQISAKNRFLAKKSIKGKWLLWKMAPNGLGFCRFGLILSIKNARKANERNAIKRKFFEATYPFTKTATSGIDFLAICLPEFKITLKSELKDKKQEIFNETERFLKKVVF